MEPVAKIEEKLKIGELVIDYQRHAISLSNKSLTLSPIEFDILAYLAQISPKVASPQNLMSEVYEYNAEPEEASAVIRTNIYRIRQKLATVSEEDELIQTIRGVGYALQPPKKIQEEQLIDGRYRLLELLGQGATATVYRAYQESLDRYVAIKFLRATLQENDNFRERFRREARHAASLQHPNIIQVYDFGQAIGSHYIVMEYIEGQTLRERLEALGRDNQEMPLPEVMRIIREIGQALSYAHREGVIHRDVKPDNIMIRPDGRAALMDFGLAKFEAAPHLTADGEISGTPNYMAPEHIQGKTIDARVDIYGLGVTMFRLVTGQLPFSADTEIGVLFQHITVAPPRPSLFVSDLAEGIEKAILKALVKDPDKRYQTIDALLADLENPGSITMTFEELMPSLSSSPTPPPHFLPIPLTPFVRRTEEVNTIQSRLMQEEVRLLTLLGFGGVGKTRLALEVAKNMLPAFSDGIFFIDLTAVKRLTLLPSAIAHTIHMPESGIIEAKDQLLAYLQTRQILFIMDNFEHVLEAAPFVNEILTAAPRCKIMTTSREPLRLYGENLFRIKPLSLPTHHEELPYETLCQIPAVQLFSSRAQAANPDFRLAPENIIQVIQLCTQLDGLPLALELAASQAYNYTLPEILDQLSDRLGFLTEGPRDRSPRQQTMRGAIDWSYELLNETEQLDFSQLAVFSGRFTADAAAEIIGPVDLKNLVRKSLLQEEIVEGGRPKYFMLKVLADYALECLEAQNLLPNLQQNHTAYYLSLVKTAEPHLTGLDPTPWFERLEEAHDNLRAVLHRSLNDNAFEQTLTLTSILWRLWAVYSYLSEGSLWLKESLTNTADISSVERAKALYGAGRISLFQQNFSQASHSFTESLLIYKELGLESGQATVLNSLGEIALKQNDHDQASRQFEEALLLFRANENSPGIVQTLTNLGQLAFHQSDYEQANKLLLESLALEEEMGRPEATAIVLNGLGEVARIQNRINEAAVYYQRALDIYRELNYNIGQAVMLHNLGQLNILLERFQTAVSLFRESLKLLRTMEEKVIVAWNLAGLGSALLNLGNIRRAVWLFSVTQSLLAVQGGRLDALDETIYNRYMAESRKRLSAEDWELAWLEGQTIPLESELLDIVSLTPVLPKKE